MAQRHKHADLIHAWAEGARIQYRRVCAPSDGWFDYEQEESPTWTGAYEYRIKPEKKPDVVNEYMVSPSKHQTDCPVYRCINSPESANLRLTFSGDTGKLIKAEVL